MKAETYRRRRQAREEEICTSTTGFKDPQLGFKPEVPTRNIFSPLRSIEIEADHGDDADDSTQHQQHQASSSQAGSLPLILLTSQVNLVELQR
jgi:hypothetical protein